MASWQCIRPDNRAANAKISGWCRNKAGKVTPNKDVKVDCVLYDNDRFALFVADVSGKFMAIELDEEVTRQIYTYLNNHMPEV